MSRRTLPLLLLIALALAWRTTAFAASTPRHGLNYTAQESVNTNFSRIDDRLPLGGASRPVVPVVFCGNPANNGTNYLSPGAAGAAVSAPGIVDFGGALCDGEDNGTEGTADEILWKSTMRALSMCCEVSSSGSNGVTITLRSATADLSPSLTMTIPTSATFGCVNAASYSTAPVVAAGATNAVKVVDTEDLSSADALCVVNYELGQ